MTSHWSSCLCGTQSHGPTKQHPFRAARNAIEKAACKNEIKKAEFQFGIEKTARKNETKKAAHRTGIERTAL